MKNKINIYIIYLTAIVLFAASCSKRQIVPDGDLAKIFRDAFLSNAYVDNRGIKLDSLRLYEPIFNKYGYTVDDVQYTIGSFSTRKSARLGDVVERSIAMLESEGKRLDYEIAILDTIDRIVVRRAARIIYSDSLITMHSMRDTSDVRLTFRGLSDGQYKIEFRYLIDTTDGLSKGYKVERWMMRKKNNSALEKSKKRGDTTTIEKFSHSTAFLSRHKPMTYENLVMVDGSTLSLDLYLARPVLAKGTPSVTIKDLKITKLATSEFALDSIYREILPIKIFDNEFTLPIPADSL